MAQPCFQIHTLPRLARPTLNDLQQDKHENASLFLCACAETFEAGIDVVCVERGGPMWRITILTDTSKHTDEKKKEAPYMPRMTRFEEAFSPIENQEKKASRASLLRGVTKSVLPR